MRAASRLLAGHRGLLFVVFVGVCAAGVLAPSPAAAGRCVGVFFRGFGASAGTSGMDQLEAHLVAAFGGRPERPFSTDVFDWFEQPEAAAFVAGFGDIDCVVVAGHSFGANAAIEFAAGDLAMAGLPVDVLVQFDSVGANDGVLPGSVVAGFNYHQVSTGFFEPEGEANVQGSTNVSVELDYGVSNSAITHTEIDCPLFERSPPDYAALFGTQPDLYARVEAHVAPLFEVAPVPGLGVPGLLLLGLAGAGTGARLSRGPRVRATQPFARGARAPRS